MPCGSRQRTRGFNSSSATPAAAKLRAIRLFPAHLLDSRRIRFSSALANLNNMLTYYQASSQCLATGGAQREYARL